MEYFGVRIAVHMILIKDNNILLGRRINTNWMPDKYNLPAGHLEENETLIDAVIRETKEEVGIFVLSKDIEYVHMMQRMERGYIDIFFRANLWEGEAYIAEPHKCDDVKWFPLDNLPDNIIPSQKLGIELALKGVTFSEFDPADNK
ncbi:MAG: NUDIX domain-containing protein [Patescibacteria group bacterium]